MANIKIVKNGNGDDVVFSALLRWGFKVLTGAGIVVLASAVIGAFTLLRKADKTIDAMEALTIKVDAYIDTNEKLWELERQIDANNTVKFEQIKNRLTSIDRKVEP